MSTMHRVDELYMRATGKPISQTPGPEAIPFLQAKATRSGPIWDMAARETAREHGLQGVISYVSNPLSPQAFLTPEEQAVRYSKTQQVLSPKLAFDVNQAASTAPRAAPDPAILSAITDASAAFNARLTGTPEQPEPVAKILAAPTNQGLQQIVRWLQEGQTFQNPLATGYGESGTPDEARLRAAMALYSNAGLGVAGQTGQQLEELSQSLRGMGSGEVTPPGQSPFFGLGRPQLSSKGMNPISQVLARVQAMKDAEKTANPQLAAYLAWRQLNPTKTLDDYLKEQRSGKLVRPPTTP
jgi:hypothetical protein